MCIAVACGYTQKTGGVCSWQTNSSGQRELLSFRLVLFSSWSGLIYCQKCTWNCTKTNENVKCSIFSVFISPPCRTESSGRPWCDLRVLMWAETPATSCFFRQNINKIFSVFMRVLQKNSLIHQWDDLPLVTWPLSVYEPCDELARCAGCTPTLGMKR